MQDKIVLKRKSPEWTKFNKKTFDQLIDDQNYMVMYVSSKFNQIGPFRAYWNELDKQFYLLDFTIHIPVCVTHFLKLPKFDDHDY